MMDDAPPPLTTEDRHSTSNDPSEKIRSSVSSRDGASATRRRVGKKCVTFHKATVFRTKVVKPGDRERRFKRRAERLERKRKFEEMYQEAADDRLWAELKNPLGFPANRQEEEEEPPPSKDLITLSKIPVDATIEPSKDWMMGQALDTAVADDLLSFFLADAIQ